MSDSTVTAENGSATSASITDLLASAANLPAITGGFGGSSYYRFTRPEIESLFRKLAEDHSPITAADHPALAPYTDATWGGADNVPSSYRAGTRRGDYNRRAYPFIRLARQMGQMLTGDERFITDRTVINQHGITAL